jgi:hypothetical protein
MNICLCDISDCHQILVLRIVVLLQENFDKEFQQQLDAAVEVTDLATYSRIVRSSASIKVLYKSFNQLISICESLGLMADIKAGVPRGAYMGVIPYRASNKPAFVVPAQGLMNEKGYQQMVLEQKEEEKRQAILEQMSWNEMNNKWSELDVKL